MTAPAVRSRRRTERRLAALRERWGSFSLRTATAERGEADVRAAADPTAECPADTVNALVYDADDRVLLVRPEGSVWRRPAGACGPEDRFADAAARTVRETAGIEIEAAGVWSVTRRRVVDRGDPERRAYRLTVDVLARAADGGRPTDPSGSDGTTDAGWFAPPAWPRPVHSGLPGRELPAPPG